MNKALLITAVFMTLLYLPTVKAIEAPEEVLVPTINPETGQAEYRECPNYPACPPAFMLQELEDEEDEQ